MNPTGFLVMEICEDYEQALVVVNGKNLPFGGILDWSPKPGSAPRAIFPTRKAARSAIDRTEHYRLAFGRTDLPERKFCHVVPVVKL